MKTVAMIGWIQNLERKSKPVLLLTGAVFLALVGAVEDAVTVLVAFVRRRSVNPVG